MDSVNSKTGDVLLDAQDVGAMQSPSDSGSQGQILVKSSNGVVWRDSFQSLLLTATSFVPQDRTIYSYTPQASDSISFLPGNKAEFYIDVHMPSPAVSFTFPASMIWAGPVPAIGAGETKTIQVLYDGTTYRASSYPDLSDFARLSVDN